MKNLSSLKIRNRINSLGFANLKRNNTQLEEKRIFWMEQVLIKKQIAHDLELRNSGCRVLIADRF